MGFPRNMIDLQLADFRYVNFPEGVSLLLGVPLNHPFQNRIMVYKAYEVVRNISYIYHEPELIQPDTYKPLLYIYHKPLVYI
jgi:hypothetical protein